MGKDDKVFNRVLKEMYKNISKVLGVLLVFEVLFFFMGYSVFGIFIISLIACMLWSLIDEDYFNNKGILRFYENNGSIKANKNVLFNLGFLIHNNLFQICWIIMFMAIEAPSGSIFDIALNVIYYSMFIFYWITDSSYFVDRNNLNGPSKKLFKYVILKLLK